MEPLATSYDKLAANYLAFIQLASPVMAAGPEVVRGVVHALVFLVVPVQGLQIFVPQFGINVVAVGATKHYHPAIVGVPRMNP